MRYYHSAVVIAWKGEDGLGLAYGEMENESKRLAIAYCNHHILKLVFGPFSTGE
jgi:hypothetical protein